MLYNFILSELEDPSKWIVGPHTFDHKKSKQRIWVANGETYVDTYPETNAFTSAQRKILWKRIQELQKIDETGKTELQRKYADKELLDMAKRWGFNLEDYKTPIPPKKKKVMEKLVDFLGKFKVKVVYK